MAEYIDIEEEIQALAQGAFIQRGSISSYDLDQRLAVLERKETKTDEQVFVLKWLKMHATSLTCEDLLGNAQKLLPLAKRFIPKTNTPRARLIAEELLYSAAQLDEQDDARTLALATDLIQMEMRDAILQLLVPRKICRSSDDRALILSMLQNAEVNMPVDEFVHLAWYAINQLPGPDVATITKRVLPKLSECYHASAVAGYCHRAIRRILHQAEIEIDNDPDGEISEEYKELFTALMRTLESTPDSEKDRCAAYYYLACFEMNNGSEEIALEAIDAAIQICPKNSDAQRKFFELLKETRDRIIQEDLDSEDFD